MFTISFTDNKGRMFYWTGQEMNLCQTKDDEGRPVIQTYEPKKYAKKESAAADLKAAESWCKKNGCRELADRLTVSSN